MNTCQAKGEEPLTNCEVETGSGKEGVSVKNHICVGCGNVSLVKDRRRRGRRIKAGRNTRSVAAGIDSQRMLEILP